MYSVVLATMMTASTSAPDFWLRNCCPPPRVANCSGCYGSRSCYGCYGYVAYRPVYVVPYTACYGCYGCSGTKVITYSYSCTGCFGGYATPVAPPAATKVVPVPTKPQAQPSPALPNPKQGAANSNNATVTFKAPLDVTISIDGHVIHRNSAEESFSTPALDADKSYSYTIEATREDNDNKVTLTRKVPVTVGATVVVDFAEFSAIKTASR